MSTQAPLEIRPVRNGRGIVATASFARGDVVCRLKGKLVSSARLWRWWDTAPQRAANCIRFDDDRYLDPHGELGAFANHSCHPNAGIHRERGRLVLRALRAIRAGEEVTHDYSTLLAVDDIWRMRCNCGSRRCRGTVKDVRSIPAPVRRAYVRAGAIPAFVLAGMASGKP